MNKAFVVAPSGVEIARECARDVGILKRTIISHTVVVETRDSMGEALLVAGKIITSLFLVRNYTQVYVVMPKQRKYSAFVTRKDERMNLAEITLADLAPRKLGHVPSENMPIISPGAIGAPLLIPDSSSGKPEVTIAGMCYVITMCPRKENWWNIGDRLPSCMAGGGIWSLCGKFTGLTLTTKKSLTKDPRAREMILALPAETVLNFAESN